DRSSPGAERPHDPSLGRRRSHPDRGRLPGALLGADGHACPRLVERPGVVAEARPQRAVGLAILAASVLLRYLSGLAAELFTMRTSMIGAFAGLLVFEYGWRQIRAWWLPFALLCLSVPIPSVILNTLALPLQLKASIIGAAL